MFSEIRIRLSAYEKEGGRIREKEEGEIGS